MNSYHTPICPYCKTIFFEWEKETVEARQKLNIHICEKCGKKYSIKPQIIYYFENEKYEEENLE